MNTQSDKNSPAPGDEILIDRGLFMTRAALIRSGEVQDLYIQPFMSDLGDGLGGIFLGRVTKLLTGADAAFVDILPGVSGFLSAHDTMANAGGQGAKKGRLPIASCVHEGQSLAVQITQSAQKDKAPRLSARLAWPGLYAVLMPGIAQCRVSNNVRSKDEQKRLKAIARTMQEAVKNQLGLEVGFVIRTAAQGVDECDLLTEAMTIAKTWAAIAKTKKAAPLTRLDDPGDPLQKVLRDWLSAEVTKILVSQARDLAPVKTLVHHLAPSFCDLVALHKTGGALFEEHGLEAVIESLVSPRVDLPGGGWLTIEPTEALIVIDVNSGTQGRGKGAQGTARQTNLQAIDEIARQLRLRKLGGLIVIDLIHMSQKSDRQDVRQRLIGALAGDPTPCKVGEVSAFGLLELTRKRSEPPLATHLVSPSVPPLPRPALIAQRLCADLEQTTHGSSAIGFSVRVSVTMKVWLEGEGAAPWSAVKARLGLLLDLKGQDGWPLERFDIAPKN